MALKRLQPVTHLHGRETARALRALADRADRGEVLGVAIVALGSDREHEMWLAGAYDRARELAFFGVSRMASVLLRADD